MTGAPGLARTTVLKFGPSYMTNATLPFIMLSSRQTMDPSWALYVVLGVQPVLLTLIFAASFALSYFSAVDGGNFGIIGILAGVRTETLKLFNGASFSGTLARPIGMKIDTMTSRREKEPQTSTLSSMMAFAANGSARLP